VIGEDVRAGRLVEVMPGYHMPPVDILAIYASRRHLSAKVRVMVDFLVDALQDSPLVKGGVAAVDKEPI
jgi:DNA-binding transcriptional LysR family regulator